MHLPSHLHFLLALLALSACSKTPDPPSQPNTPAKTVQAPITPPIAVPESPKEFHGPVARVNGVEIPEEVFFKQFNKFNSAFTGKSRTMPDKMARSYRQTILHDLIDQELLKQKLETEGITASDEEILAELNEYKAMFRTEENFQRYLKDANGSVEQLTENLKHNASLKKLLSFQGDLRPSETDMKAYYNENLARYTTKEQINASHILIKVDAKAGPAAEKASKALADEIYKEAIKPETDFAELARQKSQGPTAPKGGELGFFGRGKMVAEFENAAFALKKGEISKPVRSQYGWHIIKLNDRKDAHVQPFEEAKDKIGTLVEGRNYRKAKAILLKKLNEEAKIEILLPPSLLPEPENPVDKAKAEGNAKAEAYHDGDPAENNPKP